MTVYLKRQHNVAQYKQFIGDGTQPKNEPKNIKSQSHRSIIYCHCESTGDATYKTVSVLQFHVLRFHVLLFPVQQFHARDVQRPRVRHGGRVSDMPAEADRRVTAAVACAVTSHQLARPGWMDGWSVVLRSTRHNTGHFGDVLLSQSPGRGTGTEKNTKPNEKLTTQNQSGLN